MSNKLSEQDLYALFEQLSTDDMPSGMNARIEQQVLAEVRQTLQPSAVMAGRGSNWFAQIFENIRVPNLQLLPSFAMGAAAAAIIVVLMLRLDLVNRLIGLDTGPNTAGQPTAQVDEVTVEPTATDTDPVAQEAGVDAADTATPTTTNTATPVPPTPVPVEESDSSAPEVLQAEEVREEAVNVGSENNDSGSGEQIDAQVAPAVDAVAPESAYPAPASVDVGEETEKGTGSASGASSTEPSSIDSEEVDNSENSATGSDDANNAELAQPTATTMPASSAIVQSNPTPVWTNTPTQTPGGSSPTSIATSTSTTTLNQSQQNAVAINPTTLVPTATPTATALPTQSSSGPVQASTPTKTQQPSSNDGNSNNSTLAATPTPTPSLTPTTEPTQPSLGGSTNSGAVPTNTPTKEQPAIVEPTKTNTPVPQTQDGEDDANSQPTADVATETNTPIPTLTATKTSTPVPTETPTSVSLPNRPPNAPNFEVMVDEDGQAAFNFYEYVSDDDGDSVSISILKSPDHGTLVVSNGQGVYTPQANYHGNDNVLANVTDSKGLTAISTITFKVASTNDLPEAIADNYQVVEDSPVVVNVMENDSDIDGDEITIVAVGAATQGTATLLDDGTVEYVPSKDFNGTDAFLYTISDGIEQVSASVDIQVVAAQDAPQAVADSATVDEDGIVEIDVLANDFDVDQDSIQITAFDSVSSGLVEVIGEGTIIRYTAAQNATGQATFSYTISDRTEESSSTVTVTINPIADAPQAIDDVIATEDDSPVSITPLTNDVDVDGDALTLVEIKSAPANGLAEIQTGNVIKYTPNINFSGSDIFTYVVQDTAGLVSEAQVTVNVTAVNDPPTATADTVDGPEDQPLTINVLTNDSDPDNDTLQIVDVTQPEPQQGLVSFNAGGTVRLTPTVNYNGPIVLTYSLSDGVHSAQSNVTFNLSPVPDAPTPIEDLVSVAEDTQIDIPVLANDADVDGDALSISAVGQPSFGTATTDGTKVTYTPAQNFVGADSFTYTVNDGALTATGTVQVAVTEVNDPPQVEDKSVTMPEDTKEGEPSTFIDVLSGAVDPEGDALTLVGIVTQPAHGTSRLTADNQVMYWPAENYNGEDSLTVQVSDGGSEPQTIVVTITVTPVADKPDAGDDSLTALEDPSEPIRLDVIANDNDIDDVAGNTSLQIVNVGAVGTATVLPAPDLRALLFTPAPNFTGIVSFTYTVLSTNGQSDTATVIVTVDPVNDAPTAIADSATVAQGGTVDIDVLANDTDVDLPNDQLTVGLPTQDLQGLQIVDNKVSYTPAEGLSGVVEIVYTISDSAGAVSQSTISVNITPAADVPPGGAGNQDDTGSPPPTAADAAATADQGVAIPIRVIAPNIPLTVISVEQTANAQISIRPNNKVISYKPNPDFVGVDTFTYTAVDAAGTPSQATVTVTVGDVNSDEQASENTQAPVADPVTVTTAGQPVTVDVGNAQQGLTVTVDSPATGGVVQAVGTTVTVTPSSGYTGTFSLNYTVANEAGTASSTITVTVDAP